MDLKSIIKLKNIITDKQKAYKFIENNKSSITVWFSCAFLCLLIFHFFSDGDFSFTLTLSSLIANFSFFLILYYIEAQKSCAGVSRRMMETYLILVGCRLIAIIPFEG